MLFVFEVSWRTLQRAGLGWYYCDWWQMEQSLVTINSARKYYSWFSVCEKTSQVCTANTAGYLISFLNKMARQDKDAGDGQLFIPRPWAQILWHLSVCSACWLFSSPCERFLVDSCKQHQSTCSCFGSFKRADCWWGRYLLAGKGRIPVPFRAPSSFN